MDLKECAAEVAKDACPHCGQRVATTPVVEGGYFGPSEARQFFLVCEACAAADEEERRETEPNPVFPPPTY